MRTSYYVRSILPRSLHRPVRNAVARVQAPLLRGSARHCPICGGSFRLFLAVPGRNDTGCPRCYSAERHRLLWLYLRDRTDFFTVQKRVLHIAPEHCVSSRFRALPNLDYVTADLVAPADVKLDLTNACFPSESFDVILCHHVLQHIPDDATAMRELRRLLRPDGFAIVTVPFDERESTFEPDIDDPHERFRLLGEHDHVRWYGRRDFPNRLAAAGLQVSVEGLPVETTEGERRRLAIRDQTLHVCRPAASREPVPALAQ